MKWLLIAVAAWFAVAVVWVAWMCVLWAVETRGHRRKARGRHPSGRIGPPEEWIP